MFKNSIIALTLLTNSLAFATPYILTAKGDAHRTFGNYTKTVQAHGFVIEETDPSTYLSQMDDKFRLYNWHSAKATQLKKENKILGDGYYVADPTGWNDPVAAQKIMDTMIAEAPEYYVSDYMFREDKPEGFGKNHFSHGVNLRILKKIEGSCKGENRLNINAGHYGLGNLHYSCEYEEVLEHTTRYEVFSFKPKTECKVRNGNTRYFDIGPLGYYVDCAKLETERKSVHVSRPDWKKYNEELDAELARN